MNLGLITLSGPFFVLIFLIILSFFRDCLPTHWLGKFTCPESSTYFFGDTK